MILAARAFGALLVLLFAGCGQPSEIGRGLPIEQAQADHPDERVIGHNAAHLFPDAAEVRLYVESGRYTEDDKPILIDQRGRLLNESERREVEASISLVSFEPSPDVITAGPACFIPHHFFRYYDRSGKQVGEAAVCFCCAQVGIAPTKSKLTEDQDYRFDQVRLKKLVRAMGLPTDIECATKDEPA